MARRSTFPPMQGIEVLDDRGQQVAIIMGADPTVTPGEWFETLVAETKADLEKARAAVRGCELTLSRIEAGSWRVRRSHDWPA